MEYLVTVVWDRGASTKLTPSVAGDNLHTWVDGNTFYASEIVPDVDDPNNPLKMWAKISQGLYAGKYVAVKYPASDPANYVRCAYALVSGIPVITRTHIIEVFSDGSITIDGNPYQ